MSDHTSKQFIEQAQQSLGSGQIVEALDFAQQAATLDPQNGEAFMLCGIALSQLNRPQEAEEAFSKSASLTPNNPKLYYNLAVHYYTLGNKQEAYNASRRALDLDPSHASSRDLVIRLEGELGMRSTISETQTPPVPFSQQPPSMPPQMPSHYYANYEPPMHSMEFVRKMGKAWGALMAFFAAIEAIGSIIYMSVSMQILNLAMRNPNDYDNFAKTQERVMQMPQIGTINVSFWIGVLGAIGLLMWLIFDIMDRRSSWAWLVPMLVCCCIFGWIFVPLYYLVGRPKYTSK